MTKLNSLGGTASLSIAHMAGMIALASLRLCNYAIQDQYTLSPEHSGLTVTAILSAIFIATVVLAPLYKPINPRLLAFDSFIDHN